MICIDTTVLIDEFRAAGNPTAPVNQALLQNGAERLIVPAVAAGEFLDGAARISEIRLQEALLLLRSRQVAEISLHVAEHYGRVVSQLAKKRKLAGRSHNDLWIASTALAHGARLLTRNARHFQGIDRLELMGYGG